MGPCRWPLPGPQDSRDVWARDWWNLLQNRAWLCIVVNVPCEINRSLVKLISISGVKCPLCRFTALATRADSALKTTWVCGKIQSQNRVSHQNLCRISSTNFCDKKSILKGARVFSTEFSIHFNWHTGNGQFIPIKYLLKCCVHKLIIALSRI